MKHLIAIDIDGTLVQSDGKLSKENIETIHKINALGHKVVLATRFTFKCSSLILKRFLI